MSGDFELTGHADCWHPTGSRIHGNLSHQETTGPLWPATQSMAGGAHDRQRGRRTRPSAARLRCLPAHALRPAGRLAVPEAQEALAATIDVTFGPAIRWSPPAARSMERWNNFSWLDQS